MLTPGEPERMARAKRMATGVPLPEEAWEAILASARSVGVNGDPRGESGGAVRPRRGRLSGKRDSFRVSGNIMGL